MSNIRNVSVDVTKLDKTRFVTGKKGGVYLSLDFKYNKDGADQYGNAGFVTQSPTKEERAAKTKMPIVGNFKVWDDDAAPAKKPQPKSWDDASQEVPF